MGTELDNWRERLSGAKLPVLRRCAEGVGGLRENAGGHRLGAIIEHDPLLSAQIFRAANRRPGTSIRGIEQAPIIVGADNFRRLVSHAPVVEEQLSGEALEAYFQALRRAHSAAWLARFWSEARGYAHPQEFFFGALFMRIGELALRGVDPEAARRVDESPGVSGRWTGAETAVLGFSAAQLSLALARAWNLPELTHLALEDTGAGKGELARLATALVDAAAVDPRSDVTQALLDDLAGNRPGTAPRLAQELFAGCARALRETQDWYPLPARARVLMIYPGAYRWDRGPTAAKAPSERPATSPAAASAPAAPKLAAATPNPSVVIQRAMVEMQRRLGVRRTLFAILSPDRHLLRARLFEGVDNESPLRTLELDSGQPSLFSRLLEKPQQIWVNRDNQGRFHALYTDDMRRLLGDAEYFAGSIFVDAKPVGILYGDELSGDKDQEGRAFRGFKTLCDALSSRLSSAAARPQPRAAAKR